MTKYIVTLGSFPLTDYLSVSDVKRSILPPREISLLKIPSRHGEYFSKATYGVRKIDLEVIIRTDTEEAYIATVNLLAHALDLESPTELILGDDPSKSYYAILSGSTDLDQLLKVGKGTLSFLCPDPFAYSNVSKVITPINHLFLFNNAGTTSTFPKFTVNFTQDATFVSIVGPEGVVLIGTPRESDKIILPKTQYVLNDPMSSLTGWSNNGNTSLDAGRVSSGTYIVQDGIAITAQTYGTAATGSKIWHGPAIRKTLSELVQDFSVRARIDFFSQDGTSNLDGNQKGRLEIYLLNQSGGKIGKLVMRDSYENYEFNIPEIYIQNTTVLEDEPKAPGGKTTKQKLYTQYFVKKGDTWTSIAKKYNMTASQLASSNGMTTSSSLPVNTRLIINYKTLTKTVYPEHVGIWNDFWGELQLQRVGTTWYAEVSRVDSNMKKVKTIKKTIYDVEGDFTTASLASIVIHFAQYEADPVVQKMRVTDLKVVKHNVNTVIDIPALFQAGDELTIDFNDSSVFLNGDKLLHELDVASTFFPLYDGLTEVKVNSDDPGATFEAEFTERYL